MPTTINTLIASHYGEVTAEDAERIIAVSIGYIFRVVSATDMSYVMRECLGDKVKVIDFRRDLQTGYYLKNVKLWLWRIVSRGYSPSRAQKLMPKYGIEPRDISLARMIMRRPKLRGELTKLARRYKSHPITKYDRILDQCLQDCEEYITRFAIRKLRFLTFSGFMSLDDIVLDLKYYGLYGMLLQYPKVEDRLHLTNVCKRAVHNFGMNMIQQHTTKGRASLRQETDGTFSAIKLSIDASEGGYMHTENQMSDLEGNLLVTECEEADYGDRLTVDSLLSSHKGKKKQFLQLLCGDYNAEFSNWLHAQGMGDNDELMDRHLNNNSVNKYVDLVAEYLEVGAYKANIFLNQLRRRL